MSSKLRSMTGFGSATGESDRYRVTVDARSVNHRALDLVVRVREPFRRSEKALRDLVKEGVGRGRVELFLDVSFVGQEAVELEVDEELAERVVAALQKIRSGGAEVLPPTTGDLLRVPGVVSVHGAQRDWIDDDEALLLEVARCARPV